ncbi:MULTISPECIES: dermonecrotic toxin domain-containing protein [Pseudomonas]|uniref:RING-type E3 ubiquitin transferase n=1 Tax=Pseudomonas juntendi TaxID=2666183 RepID=A0ABZ2JGV9_9PSED|nr:DUF6543 domain-containing protein [Pseudomonas sp. BJP69]QDR70449.1 hypothetical protein FPB55_23900 [Pseudomonas sp. BJP69]
MIDATKPAACEPDFYHQLVSSKLPAWVVDARPEQRRQLRQAASQRDPRLERACLAHPTVAKALVQTYGQHVQAEANLSALLATLPDLQRYATELLSTAVSQRLGTTLDVERTYLMNLNRAAALTEALSSPGGDPFVTSSRALKLATQPLLHCALQNFEAFEAQPDGLRAGGHASAILDSNDVGLASQAVPLPIVAEAFAALARELDIGGKYQRLLDALDPPGEQPNAPAIAGVFKAAERSTFELQVHYACLLGRIDTALHATLLKLATEPKVEHDGRPVLCAGIELLHVPLTGAMAIGLDARRPVGAGRFPPGPVYPYAGWVVLYLPGMPEPLTQHASRADAEAFLREQLPAFRRPECQRLLPDRHKRHFLERIANAQVRLHVQPFTRPYLDELACQRQKRLRDDGLFHAVPTAMQNGKTAQRHLDYFKALAFVSLNVAALFIPPLGAAMLGVTALQLANETFEGIDSWLDGDRQQAFDYLMDVIDNVAIMAALAAAGGGQATPVVERIPVETPSFIEELQPIDLADGERRLWHADLAPFAHDRVLPGGLEPDESGLLHYGGKTWLPVENRVYSVTPAATGYRLEHPTRPAGYQPKALHNGAGAWLLESEQPQSWDGARLLRRLGHLSGSFDEATLQRILHVCDIHEDTLRHCLAHNRRLPALLEDTLQRFKLDAHIRQLPDQSAWPAAFTTAYARIASPLPANGEVIRRVYPSLPAPIIDELVRNASAIDLQALGAGKVPLHLAEEIRAYQQHVRLARAYEGLYLAGAQSWDSDRLIMQTLPHLPGWPADTRLRLLQRSHWPDQDHAIGAQGSSPWATITHSPAGYIVHAQGEPGAVVRRYPQLFSALHAALPDAMQGLGVTSGEALQHLLQQSPLLPRPALRDALGMQPPRPGYRSPMRLADGRVGYRLSSGDDQSQGSMRQHLLSTLRATGIPERTGRPAEQVLMSLAANGRSRLQILEYLTTLMEQRNALQRSLDDWSEAISPASDQAARTYDTLREAIMQHWYDTALEDDAALGAELRVQGVPLTDIPLTLPDFFYRRVRSLHLLDLPSGTLAGWGQSERLMQRLLRLMPGLEALEISRPYNPRATPSLLLPSVPTIASTLPNLRRLAMTNQNLAFSNSHLGELAGHARLAHLDLSGNRLQQGIDRASFHWFTLDYLGLNRMQLSQWPTGIDSETLSRIGHLSLQDNNLTSLPAFLLGETPLQRAPVISLQGNPINETHLQRLLLNERPETAQVTVDQPPALNQRLERLRSERQLMRDAIDGWVHASSSSNPLTQAALTDRQRMAAAINAFWERQEQGQQYLRLQLEDVAIEHFPRRLPAFFGERVHAMTLTRLSGTSAQLSELLARFPNITRLTIDAHQGATPALASALPRLPRLTYLEFRNMGLEVDQAMLETFAELEHLTSLDLSGNRVGNITQVPARLSANLTSLELTNMNLHAWPDWCDALLPLELLDLSSNNITQLPEHILSNLNNAMPISSISLFDNPLPDATILRVRAYSDSQRSYSFALDIPDNLMLVNSSSEGSLDHPHFPLQGDDTPRLEDWLLGDEAQNEALRSCWQQLEGSDLLRLAGRLHNAAPFVDPTTRGDFCARVRLMLVAAAANQDERPIMESIAAAALPDPETGSQTCHDGALQEFNNIELYLMANRLLIDAGDTLHSLHQRLLRLFRVDQLEKLAATRTGSGDLVSVRLAYRRELARELDLPIADSMRFRGAANLARGELSRVLESVRQSEHSEMFIDYLLANSSWAQRLRGEHAPRFAQIEARYRQRVLELSGSEHPLHEEVALQQGLWEDKQQEELALLRELTLTFVGNS